MGTHGDPSSTVCRTDAEVSDCVANDRPFRIHPGMSELDFHNHNCPPNYIGRLVAALEGSSIRHLTLVLARRIDSVDWFKVFRTMPNLATLSLKFRAKCESDLPPFSRSFSHWLRENTTLTSLRICDRIFRRDGALVLEAIRGAPNIEKLVLEHAVEPEAWGELPTLIRCLKKLRVLRLGELNVKPGPLTSVLMAIEDSPNITSLTLSGITVDKRCCRALAGIVKAGHLQDLVLRNSFHGIHGKLHGMFSAFQHNTSIRVLHLIKCDILWDELKHLFESLTNENVLKELHIQDTLHGKIPGEALERCLLASNLEVLSLFHNSVGDHEAHYIARGLAQNRTLRHLCLEDNEIGLDALEHIACAIGQCPTLERVELPNPYRKRKIDQVIQSVSETLCRRRSAPKPAPPTQRPADGPTHKKPRTVDGEGTHPQRAELLQSAKRPSPSEAPAPKRPRTIEEILYGS